MRQTRTRPFVYPDPIPPPLSLGPSFPTPSPLDTSVKEIALVEMASPIPAFASVMREANSIGHHRPPTIEDQLWEQNLLLESSPDPCKPYLTNAIYPVPIGANCGLCIEPRSIGTNGSFVFDN